MWIENLSVNVKEPLDRIAKAFERIAAALDAVVDKEKGAIRMVDIERAKVYSTHLGGKLREGAEQ